MPTSQRSFVSGSSKMNRWDTRTAFLMDPVSCVDAGFHEALGSRPVPAGHDLYLSAEVDVTLSYANRPGEPARTEALQIL